VRWPRAANSLSSEDLPPPEHPVTTTAIADGPGTRRMPFFKVLPVLAHGREAHSLVKIREIL